MVFDAFYRSNPSDGGYAICAGLEQVITYIEELRFDDEDIAYLRSLKIFDEDFLAYLRDFRFSRRYLCHPRGNRDLPQGAADQGRRSDHGSSAGGDSDLKYCQPSVPYRHQSRPGLLRRTGRRRDGIRLRRAQGPDSGTYGARAAVIGGCKGTSNVLAGQMFDVPVLGTHAHSWIMSFPDEYTAFKEYAKLYPNACTLLVDTYDTLKSGVPNAIRVFTEMRDSGVPMKNYGIRMDSGDLAYLSKKVRKMLDDAGFPDAIISASNDLDEYLIESLKLQGATITSWGVGTNLITSKDCPAFGGVYKLAAIENDKGEFIPKIKLSENTEKVTNPGNKTVYRIYDKETGQNPGRSDLSGWRDF